MSALTNTFPDFVPDSEDIDLPYVVLGDFARFLLRLQESEGEPRLENAVQLIERLHIEGDSYVREAATVGLLESVQNTWARAGMDPEVFGRRLRPESRRWWDSLEKFWQKDIPYVGADSNGITEPDAAPNTERIMSKHTETGRDATETEIREAERILSLTPIQQRGHPSAVPADHSKLSHINTYGSLPEFYLDQPFTCRKCGKREIWKARDQKWYYEEAKGHIDARAVECHDCRTVKKRAGDEDAKAT